MSVSPIKLYISSDLPKEWSLITSLIDIVEHTSLEEALKLSHPFFFLDSEKFVDSDFEIFFDCREQYDRPTKGLVLSTLEQAKYWQSSSQEFIPMDKDNKASYVDGLKECGLEFYPEQRLRTKDWHFLPIPGRSFFGQKRQAVIFLDRDGILNRDSGYVHQIDDLEIIEDTIKFLKEDDRLKIVVTNQSGIARGYYTTEMMEQFHDALGEALGQNGIKVEDWYFCPFHPEGQVEAYAKHSLRRKPRPGMILDFASQFPVDFKKSVMIGDRHTDQIWLSFLESKIVRREYTDQKKCKVLLDTLC